MAKSIKKNLSWMDKQPSMSECMKSIDACKEYFEGQMKFARLGMVTRDRIGGDIFTGMFNTTSKPKAEHLAENFRKAGLLVKVIPEHGRYKWGIVARRK